MSFSLVVSNSGVGGTTGVDTTGANLIVIAVIDNTGEETLTDNKSNTWTPLTIKTPAALDSSARLFYCFSPTVGAGHTVSLGTATYGWAAVAAYSGAATSPFDVQNGATGGSAVTTLSTGSVTPSQDNSLVITALALGGNASAPTISPTGPGFSIIQSLAGVSGVSYGGGLAHEIQTTATARNPAWSWTTAQDPGAVVAVFKASTAVLVVGESLRSQTVLSMGMR